MKNIKISNAKVTGQNYVGALVGKNTGTIENVKKLVESFLNVTRHDGQIDLEKEFNIEIIIGISAPPTGYTINTPQTNDKPKTTETKKI